MKWKKLAKRFRRIEKRIRQLEDLIEERTAPSNVEVGFHNEPNPGWDEETDWEV